MDEIKLKCDIHVSVMLLCMVILKSVKIIMAELIKSTAIIKYHIYVIVFYYDEVNDLKQIHVPFLNVELLCVILLTFFITF